MRQREREALGARLRGVRPPDVEGAERRAWDLLRAAQAERGPALAHPQRLRTALAAAAAAAALAALALTPAGAAVGDWIGELVRPGRQDARPVLSSLPAPGRLLVQSPGGTWIVQEDGSRRRLAGWSEASWSPGGLYVVAARRRELAALDARGELRWSLGRRGPVSTPRWSPDGFRVAYRDGRDLRVVAGDGTGDRLLARGAGPAAPAWRPGRPPGAQALAYGDGPRLRVVEVDSGRVLGVTPRAAPPSALWWSFDGRLLAAVAHDAVRVYDARGRLRRSVPLPRGFRALGSAAAHDGLRLAITGRRGRASELLVVRLLGPARPRRLFAGPGTFSGLAWSTDGQVLALGWPEADQWLFLRPGRGASAVSGIRRQFGRAARPGAWCYPERASGAPPEAGQAPCSPPGAGAGS